MHIKINQIIWFCFIGITNILSAQTNANKDIVYAGRSFTWGMNMSSYDLVVLLRADGTFNEDLEEPNWQTKVAGRYKKIKEGYFLEYLDASMESDTILIEKDTDGDTSIYYGGAQMVKMEVANKVPAGFYKYSSASSSGGMGTGLIYVGTQHYEGYNFYNNGTFDRNASGGVMVSGGGDGGGGIGGGSSSETSAKGKYTIKNGLLTLFNEDTSIEKHSFFYQNNGEKEFMVAIDGSIFFFGDEENEEETIQQTPITETKKSDEKLDETLKSTGFTILKKIKEVHGGAAIDKVNTTKAIFKISGIYFKLLIDYEREYLRLESLDTNFKYVEQIQGNNGWLYLNNTITNLHSDRINELKLSFVSGVFGLKEKVLKKTKVVAIRETEDNILLLSLQIDGNSLGYIVNKKDNSLLGNFVLKDENNEITYFSNLKKQSNILLPTTEKTETTNGIIEVNYESFSFNAFFEAKDWQKPM